jgi:hypothetical protein
MHSHPWVSYDVILPKWNKIFIAKIYDTTIFLIHIKSFLQSKCLKADLLKNK